MAFQMGPYDAEHLPDDPINPLLSIFDVITKNFLITCVICALLSYICRHFSHKNYGDEENPSEFHL